MDSLNMTSYLAMLALPYLIVAHFCGDYLLQFRATTANKDSNSWACALHVWVYALPFIFVFWWFELGWIGFFVIMVEHFLQDRFMWRVAWLKLTGRAIWAHGGWTYNPLIGSFVDQSMHLTFIAIVTFLIGRVI